MIFVMGSSSKFSEIASETMLHPNLLLPSTLHEAMERALGNLLRFLKLYLK